MLVRLNIRRVFFVDPAINSHTPTIADLFCYGDVAFAEICAFDLHRWTNVVGWTERVTALPGFKAPFALLTMQNAELS